MKVRSKRSRKGVKPNASFRAIVVRDITIQCFYGPGPRLLVPVDAGDVERIVEHLRPRAGEQHDTFDHRPRVVGYGRGPHCVEELSGFEPRAHFHGRLSADNLSESWRPKEEKEFRVACARQ